MPNLRPLTSLLANLRAHAPRVRRLGMTKPSLQNDGAAPLTAYPTSMLDKRLVLPCQVESEEEAIRAEHQDRGQFLARQERWDELADLIETADKARDITPGGQPIATLLATGARADIVLACEDALYDGAEPDLTGLEAFEEILLEFPNSYGVALVMANAHIDIGWAWRGTGWDADVPELNASAFAAHFDRATDIISDFNIQIHQSALLAGTACALLGGTAPGRLPVSDRYEKLIDLNPANPRVMRAMGNHLLPRWYGSYEELELEARRTASRTTDTWGAGAYTWVYFDAIFNDEGACANLDLPFFIEGLHDILERRPDPYTANLLAAYCANAIGQAISGNDDVDQIRSQIADCAHWIVRRHLTELHPMIWAHAARGFDNNLRIRSATRFAEAGREDAVRIITKLFQREIAAGKRIVFTDTGPIARAG